ncbi:MAG: polysaccharide biosynthesis tyrosine autokinase [Rhodospirillales bacterium]|nr:polysaccharide biosynthesis tyrosine autokinase [Rhodospirillales bacterium]MCB9980230.1 polysaccharide biosynthesis tyrosine autokinase [Rhodospirillales bacterium]
MTDPDFSKTMQDNDTLGAFSLRDLWDSIYRRKFLMIGITAFFALTALIYTKTATNIFYAESKISLENQEKNVDIEAIIPGLPMDPSFIETEIEVLSSRDLAGKVVDMLHPELKLTETSPEETRHKRDARISSILKNLEISQIGKSRAIRVGFYSSSPGYAAEVANAVAMAYIEQQIVNRYDVVSSTSNWLGERVRKLRDQVRDAETLVVQYRQREGIVDSRGIDIIEQDIIDLSRKLIDARADLTKAEARLSEIGKNGDMSNSPTVLSSFTIQKLRETEAAAKNDIARLSKEYGPSHPEMIVAQAQLSSTKAKIKQEMDNIAASLKTSHEVALANVKKIDTELNRLKSDYNKYKNSSVELQELEREAAANRELLEVLNTRWKETQAQEDVNLQDPNARVISKAIVPNTPTSPKKKLILAAAIIAGVGLSIAACIGLDQFQTGAYNGKQLQSLTGMTNISLVPRAKLDPGRGINRLADFPLKEPYAVYTESIRSISMYLRLQLTKSPGQKVFNFTSCLGNEGKSSIVSSLGRQMALEGLKVIAIDCDMRKPRLGRTFGVDPQYGFHDVLRGEKHLQDVILRDAETGLDFVCAGRLEDVNVISREIATWHKIIDQAKKHYDIILLDSPPILFVADTKLIAKESQNILCVQSKKTPVKLIAYAVDMLNRLECTLLGTIITMANNQNKYLYEYEEVSKAA